MTRTFRRSIGFALTIILMSGCALIVPPAAPTLYDLFVSDRFATIAGDTPSQILIANPKVLSSLDNDRILIKPSVAEISYLGDVRWSDKTPRLLQVYISRALAKSGGARAVGLPGDGLLIDHQLLLDVRAFQIEVAESGTRARVEFGARILNDKNGLVIASQTFETAVPASDDAVGAVKALNEALESVTADLLTWVYAKI